MAVARLYATQSAYASAAHKVKQDGLYAVVAMMCHTDAIGPNVATQTLEIVVAQTAGCHLDADMMERGVLACVEMDEVQRNAVSGTQSLAEVLVTIRLVATQTEIAMGSLHLNMPLGCHAAHGKQQRHAVGTSRECGDVFAAPYKQTMGRGKRPYPTDEFILYIIVHYI